MNDKFSPYGSGGRGGSGFRCNPIETEGSYGFSGFWVLTGFHGLGYKSPIGIVSLGYPARPLILKLRKGPWNLGAGGGMLRKPHVSDALAAVDPLDRPKVGWGLGFWGSGVLGVLGSWFFSVFSGFFGFLFGFCLGLWGLRCSPAFGSKPRTPFRVSGSGRGACSLTFRRRLGFRVEGLPQSLEALHQSCHMPPNEAAKHKRVARRA